MRLSLGSVAATALGIALLTACSGGGEATYVPTAPPLDRTLTAEEKVTIDEGLAGIADMFGITDPPAVDIVRLTSAAGHDKAMIDCMTAAGFPPIKAGQPDWIFSAAQAKPGMLAHYTCEAQYPADPAQVTSKMSAEQIHVFYEYVTTTLITCLKDHGITTTTNPPSEDTFTKTIKNGDPWSPYVNLPEQAEETYRECPSYPPDELIWGK